MPTLHIILFAVEGSILLYWTWLAFSALIRLWRAASADWDRRGGGWRRGIAASARALWRFATAPEDRRERNRLILIKLVLVAILAAQTALVATH